MMKKFFTTLCMAILLAAMVVIPSVHAEERPLEDLPICKIDGFMVAMPETLEGLEDGSSCIVKAIRSEDSENFPPSDEANGFTRSTLTITKSFKGDLKEGDTIPFAECYCIRKNKMGEPQLVCYFGHAPLLPGREYILFIGLPEVSLMENKPWTGTYCTAFSGISHYIIPSDDEIDDLFIPDNEIYRKLYPAVLKKYNT